MFDCMGALSTSYNDTPKTASRAFDKTRDGFVIAGGGGVLVHCFAGVSRSATCVIAYLMQEKEMSFEQAFSYASKRRPVIFPNMGF